MAKEEPDHKSSSSNSDSNPSQKIFQIPDFSDISLKTSIKKVVDVTNSTLATFEKATDESSTAFVSRLTSVGKQARHIANRTMTAYENRTSYGPHFVAGTALLVGGAVALRRGKFTGAFAGALGGAVAYGNVYGYQNYSTTSWRRYVPNDNDYGDRDRQLK